LRPAPRDPRCGRHTWRRRKWAHRSPHRSSEDLSTERCDETTHREGRASAKKKEQYMKDDNIVQTAINTIRTLSIDAVQQAKSGHPGTPMALAPLVYTIWNRVMRFDPQDPISPNRD